MFRVVGQEKAFPSRGRLTDLQNVIKSAKIVPKGGNLPVRKYLYFLSCDAAHLQTRLERLAKKGLALVSTDGLFTGLFEETKRDDLRYLVIPYGNARNFPRTDDFSTFGWALLGGFNGMAIFCSLPCVEPDEAGLRQKLEQDGCVHRDRLTPFLLLAGLLVMIGLLAWRMMHPGLGQAWYSTYLNAGTPVVTGALAALAAAYVVSLRSYVSAWVHGFTPLVMVGGLFFLLLLGLLGESGDKVFFILLLLVMAAALVFTLWHRSRPTAFVMAGLCLVTLAAGLLSPNLDRTAAAGRELHYETADKAVIQLTDLGIDGELRGSGYQVDGTFFARWTAYWELTDEASVSSEVTRCLTRGIADDVTERALARGNWTAERWGWSRDDGTTLLLRSGNSVAKVTLPEAATEGAITQIQAELFS